MEVESPELARGCDEGMFEELDPALFGNEADYVPGAIQPCGVGFFVWSTVLAYNADKLKTAPTSWADFWDTQKFPGKRGLRKGAKYTLEFALMADGVAPKDVYKVLGTKEGQDRAFKKLDQIKPSIQWWEAGAQPPQYLASGDVVMSSAYNGRIAAVQKESNLKVVWNGGIYDFDAWAIPKGAKDTDLAKKFIAFSVQPEQQKTYSENIAYGPANTKAVSLLSDTVKKDMPTTPENIANRADRRGLLGRQQRAAGATLQRLGGEEVSRVDGAPAFKAALIVPRFSEFAMAIAVPLNEGAGKASSSASSMPSGSTVGRRRR